MEAYCVKCRAKKEIQNPKCKKVFQKTNAPTSFYREKGRICFYKKVDKKRKDLRQT